MRTADQIVADIDRQFEGAKSVGSTTVLLLLEEWTALRASIGEAKAQMRTPGWLSMSDAPMDSTHVLLFTTCHGIVEAWFAPGEWSEETPQTPRDYNGDVWVCADDAFQIEVESSGPGEWHHGTAIAWMHKPDDPAKEAEWMRKLSEMMDEEPLALLGFVFALGLVAGVIIIIVRLALWGG